MKKYLFSIILASLFKGRGKSRIVLSLAAILVAGSALLWNSGAMSTGTFAGLSSKPHSATAVDDSKLMTYEESYTSELPVAGDYSPLILTRKGYILSYNPETLQPDWVAWRLTAGHCSGNAKRAGIEFTVDNDVSGVKADTYDYIQSGYDRGHMCPAADNKWSHEAMEQSFLMSNICPQNPGLNQGIWNDIEQSCRKWAKEYGKVYIICGPVFFSRNHKTIGKHKISVPEAFFKVVLRTSPDYRGIGFICRNTDGRHSKDFYVNTISDVERITGYRFFPNLGKELSIKVKNTADLKDWNYNRNNY